MRNKIFVHTLFILLGATALLSFVPEAKPWVEVKPAKGNCSVLMPEKPEEQSQTTHTDVGEVEIHLYLIQPKDSDENVLYGLSYSDFPAGTITSDSVNIVKDFFDNSRDGMIQSVNGKILSEKDMIINKYPGREINVGLVEDGVVVTFRYYLVKNRMYTLQVYSMSANAGNKSIAKFLNSFKLTTDK